MGTLSERDEKSVFSNYKSYDHGSPSFTLHSKIMVAAIVVLFVVVFFVLALHIYAKWFWRRRYASAIRRRYRFDFTGREASLMAGSIGLEKAVIDTLPTFTYEGPRTGDVLECAVCLCEFKENEKGRLLPKCNHSFHIECIDMWFHSHSTCPLCRTCAVPDSTLDIPTPQEHESTESTAADLPQHMEALWLAATLQQQDAAAENTGLRRATQGTGHSSPASVGANTGSISERFHEDQGIMGYPANVLSWGNHSHACSNMNLPLMEEAHPGGRSLPHIVIDIPIRSESSLTARCLSLNTPRRGGSISSLLYPSSEELPSSPNDQSLKSPATRFKSLKRLLSRERKVPPAQHSTGDCDQGGAISST
eukprot:c22861_g1_i2 orf=866-1957(+)